MKKLINKAQSQARFVWFEIVLFGLVLSYLIAR